MIKIFVNICIVLITILIAYGFTNYEKFKALLNDVFIFGLSYPFRAVFILIIFILSLCLIYKMVTPTFIDKEKAVLYANFDNINDPKSISAFVKVRNSLKKPFVGYEKDEDVLIDVVKKYREFYAKLPGFKKETFPLGLQKNSQLTFVKIKDEKHGILFVVHDESKGDSIEILQYDDFPETKNLSDKIHSFPEVYISSALKTLKDSKRDPQKISWTEDFSGFGDPSGLGGTWSAWFLPIPLSSFNVRDFIINTLHLDTLMKDIIKK